MSQNLFLVFPIPVALALVALVVVLICVARVLASLGRPAQLHAPQEHPPQDRQDQQEPPDPLEHELRTH
jgi:flagellar biosynthesis/type III secretory pathway M-ring protein FliF/YscJ